jgi:hypothetical protein
MVARRFFLTIWSARRLLGAEEEESTEFEGTDEKKESGT